MRRLAIGLGLAGALGAAVIAWHGSIKPLPQGLSIQTPLRRAADVRFIADLTYLDARGVRQVDQRIFDEILEVIRGARKQITLDVFLFNEYQGKEREETRALCRELTDALLEQKRAHPGIEVVLITDPINTVYGALAARHLDRLRSEGIAVVVTDLDPLRDSNVLYSSLWRWFIQPFGVGRAGRLPNPFGGDPVSLRSELRLLNFKANHRKTIVADSPDGWVGIVTSANPHDGSSAHGNVAIRFDGLAVSDLLETERVVARFSRGTVPSPIKATGPRNGSVAVRVLTEGKIGFALDETLASARAGDEIAVAVFYLSDRGIIDGLVDAKRRGVSVRVLLDPNKDAFGIEKNGIPNRPVAAELVGAGIPVRWCDTHGEQCHSKLLLMRQGGESTLILGSANFTRRNLRDLNLETDVLVSGSRDTAVMRDAWTYFERTWSNEPGRGYSAAYNEYADVSCMKYWMYRVSEFSGIGTH